MFARAGDGMSDEGNKVFGQSNPGLEISAPDGWVSQHKLNSESFLPIIIVGSFNNAFIIQSVGKRVGLQFIPPSLALILIEVLGVRGVRSQRWL